jgi:hypothetical protein
VRPGVSTRRQRTPKAGPRLRTRTERATLRLVGNFSVVAPAATPLSDNVVSLVSLELVQRQHAATGGDAKREFPWSGEWDGRRAITWECRLNRTTAVGMYRVEPHLSARLAWQATSWSSAQISTNQSRINRSISPTTAGCCAAAPRAKFGASRAARSAPRRAVRPPRRLQFSVVVFVPNLRSLTTDGCVSGTSWRGKHAALRKMAWQ